MDIPGYKPRIIDKIVEEYLLAFGAICIEGPKIAGFQSSYVLLVAYLMLPMCVLMELWWFC